jgi:tetratricopeptide (TPR) repeat protein
VDFLIDQDRHADAVEHEKYIVDAHPEDPFAWKKLGSIYDELKDCDQAINAFTKAVELRPEDYDGVMKLGGTYLKCKKYASAEEAFNKAIVLDSTKLVPHVYLGMTYYNWGKTGSAEKEFRYILSQDSDYGDALFFMGAIYAKKAGDAVTAKTKDAWVAGCTNARTATNYLERSKAVDSRNASRANSYLEYLQKVRNELKKKLILVGVTDC